MRPFGGEYKELCFYCGEDDYEEHIPFMFALPSQKKERVHVCCERCFWGLIYEEDSFDDAEMVLTKRTGAETGIPAVDNHGEALLQAIRDLQAAKSKKEWAFIVIENAKKRNALDVAASRA